MDINKINSVKFRLKNSPIGVHPLKKTLLK